MVYDPRDISRLQTLHGHSGAVTTAAVDPAGRWVASAGADGTVRFWTVGERRAPTREWQEHTGAVTSLTHRSTPDEVAVVSASRDRTARVWVGDDCKYRLTFRGHLGPVTAILDLDDDRVLSGGADGTIWLWRSSTGERLRRLGNTLSGPANAPGVDSLFLDQLARTGHTDAITRLLAVSGNRLLSASKDGTVRLWDIEQGDVLRLFTSSIGSVEHLDACESLDLLASGGPAGDVQVWQRTDEELLASIKVHNSRIIGLAITPDNKLISASRNGQVCLLDLTRLDSPPVVLLQHPRSLLAFALDRAGRRLVLGDHSGSLLFSNLDSDTAFVEIGAHAGGVRALAWDDAGRLVFSGGHDGRLAVTVAEEHRLLTAYSVGAPVTTLHAGQRNDVACGTTRGAIVRLTLIEGAAHV